MSWSGWLVLVSAGVPLAAAVRANRATSLFHAVVWAVAAWAAWLFAGAIGGVGSVYVALSLTGCAGVAVLGARRPGVAAWNFVVAGLLVVLLLPLAEATAVSAPVEKGTVRTVFLAALLGVTVINYLPTRLGVGAALFGVICALELSRFPGDGGGGDLSVWRVGLAPWLAWFGMLIGQGRESPVDRLWQAVRDRYGLVWGERVREQFNRAAANAGLTVRLTWTGLRAVDGVGPDASTEARAYELLVALVTRFGLT